MTTRGEHLGNHCGSSARDKCMNLMVEMSSRDMQEMGWTGLGCGLEMGGRGENDEGGAS